MRTCYQKVCDNNRTSGGTGHTTLFFSELLYILEWGQGVTTRHTSDAKKMQRLGSREVLPQSRNGEKGPWGPAASGVQLELELEVMSLDLFSSQVLDTEAQGMVDSSDKTCRT